MGGNAATDGILTCICKEMEGAGACSHNLQSEVVALLRACVWLSTAPHHSGTQAHFRDTEPAGSTQDHQISRLQTVGLLDD